MLSFRPGHQVRTRQAFRLQGLASGHRRQPGRPGRLDFGRASDQVKPPVRTGYCQGWARALTTSGHQGIGASGPSARTGPCPVTLPVRCLVPVIRAGPGWRGQVRGALTGQAPGWTDQAFASGQVRSDRPDQTCQGQDQQLLCNRFFQAVKPRTDKLLLSGCFRLFFFQTRLRVKLALSARAPDQTTAREQASQTSQQARQVSTRSGSGAPRAFRVVRDRPGQVFGLGQGQARATGFRVRSRVSQVGTSPGARTRPVGSGTGRARAQGQVQVVSQVRLQGFQGQARQVAQPGATGFRVRTDWYVVPWPSDARPGQVQDHQTNKQTDSANRLVNRCPPCFTGLVVGTTVSCASDFFWLCLLFRRQDRAVRPGQGQARLGQASGRPGQAFWSYRTIPAVRVRVRQQGSRVRDQACRACPGFVQPDAVGQGFGPGAPDGNPTDRPGRPDPDRQACPDQAALLCPGLAFGSDLSNGSDLSGSAGLPSGLPSSGPVYRPVPVRTVPGLQDLGFSLQGQLAFQGSGSEQTLDNCHCHH